MPKHYLTEKGRSAPIVVASVAGFVAIYYRWTIPDLGFSAAIEGTASLVMWIAIVVFAVRTLYLPVQYFRHGSAVTGVQTEEDDLIRRANAGEVGAKIRLSMAIKRDPRNVPWWRW